MNEDLIEARAETEEKLTLKELLPDKTEPRCNICKSNQRAIVDTLIVQGHGPLAIARQIKGADECLNGSIDTIRKSVERHGSRHLNVQEDAIRRTIEKRAAERGVLVDYAEEKLATTKAVLDLMVAKGLEQVVEPGARVKYQDILKAVELLEEYEKNAFATQVDILQKQMWAIREAVRRVCPPDLWPELARVAVELFEGVDPFVDEREVIELESGDATSV